MLNDFKPALYFLLKFLAVYFIGNIVYGVYVESCGERVDTLTSLAAKQTVSILNQVDGPVEIELNPQGPTVFIKKSGHIILNVFEGCNGINVMIVFVAFLIAFGGRFKHLVVFAIVGLLILHVANLGRLVLLYTVAQHYGEYFYFVHKYLFTAMLYLIVFALWVLWVTNFKHKRVEKVS